MKIAEFQTYFHFTFILPLLPTNFCFRKPEKFQRAKFRSVLIWYSNCHGGVNFLTFAVAASASVPVAQTKQKTLGIPTEG